MTIVRQVSVPDSVPSSLLARRRFGQGLISELDVRQFEAQVAGPAGNVAQFTRLRAEAENRLNVLLGRAPGPVPRGDSLMTIVRQVSVPDL
jgi:multidrug efflux system outer membrane protein